MKKRVDPDQLVVIYTFKLKKKKIWFGLILYITAKVMLGWSVHLTTLFSGQA